MKMDEKSWKKLADKIQQNTYIHQGQVKNVQEIEESLTKQLLMY